MFCKKCGKQLKDGAQFCMSCGTKVVMPGSSAQTREPEVQKPVVQPKPAAQSKPVERVSTPKPIQSGKKTMNLIPWIVVGILVIAVAVMGYFIWSGRSDESAEDGETIETIQDSVEENEQEPEVSEDEGDVAPVEPAEEPEEEEPAEELEEEEPVEEEVSQYFLPTSSTEYLTMSDLEGFSQDDCRMARNELYARHGRRFDDPNLQAYFDALDWYEGTIDPADFDESVMNEYEFANRDLIVQYEKDMGYR